MKKLQYSKEVRITITSTGGHSSSPHLAVNALVIAAQAVKAINAELVYRFAPDNRPGVLTKALKSGTAGNIIPAKAEIIYFYTAQDGDSCKKLDRIFTDIPNQIAGLFGAECRVNIDEGKVNCLEEEPNVKI